MTSTSAPTSAPARADRANPASGPRVYQGWQRERAGLIFGVGGLEAGVVVAGFLPVLLAVSQSAWGLVARCVVFGAAVAALVLARRHRRPLYRWGLDFVRFQVGAAMGWTAWRANAASGAASTAELERVDLPGVLSSLRTFDGPPFGAMQTRVCLINQPNTGGAGGGSRFGGEGLWLATARCEHPGIGAADEDERDLYAAGLGGMLAAAAESEEITHISVMVRTVPDDGAARSAWLSDHLRSDAPDLAAAVTRQLESTSLQASVRHEVFVTVGAAEKRIKRAAENAGGGAAGRARVLYRHLSEVEGQLRGMGVTSVSWLTSEELAVAIRTGFNPSDATAIQAASEQAARGRSTVTGVPMGAAGPTLAPAPSARRYDHDAFSTVSYAVLLPKRPTVVGSLSRILTPSQAGERRTLSLHYEPLPQAKADRQIERAVMGAELADHMKRSRGFRVSRRQQRRGEEAATTEQELAAGHTLVRMAGAAAVTVPAGSAVEDAAARFEASARAAGFQLWRLDLAQDAGFAAACIPVGVGLPRRGES